MHRPFIEIKHWLSQKGAALARIKLYVTNATTNLKFYQPVQDKTWQFTPAYRLMTDFKHDTNTQSTSKIPLVHQPHGYQTESIFRDLSFTAVRSLTHFTNQTPHYPPVLHQPDKPAYLLVAAATRKRQRIRKKLSNVLLPPDAGCCCGTHLLTPATTTRGSAITSNSHVTYNSRTARIRSTISWEFPHRLILGS